MTTPSIIINYVSDVARAQEFYARTLGAEPAESSPTFCLFIFTNGLKLGLWQRSGVDPAADAMGGGAEIGIAVSDPAQVDDLFGQWDAQGIRILQKPADMDFGRTFTAADPDGHRLRVYYHLMD